MNRPDDLDAAIASVRAGSEQPFELIVSDDGGGTARAVAEKHGATYVSGPARGLSANRNTAIAASSGQLIAFIDDDVIVSPDFIARASAQPTDVVTTGWEENYAGGSPRKVTPHNASFLGFQREDPRGQYRSIVINATVFPAQLFESALFDEQIRYGYEEIDMAKHAVTLGWRIRYDDAMWVEHHPSPTNRDSYNASLNISRLYITHKSYALYEKAPLKAAVFNVAASLHHLAYSVKGGLPVKAALGTIREARRKQRAKV